MLVQFAPEVRESQGQGPGSSPHIATSPDPPHSLHPLHPPQILEGAGDNMSLRWSLEAAIGNGFCCKLSAATKNIPFAQKTCGLFQQKKSRPLKHGACLLLKQNDMSSVSEDTSCASAADMLLFQQKICPTWLLFKQVTIPPLKQETRLMLKPETFLPF